MILDMRLSPTNLNFQVQVIGYNLINIETICQESENDELVIVGNSSNRQNRIIVQITPRFFQYWPTWNINHLDTSIGLVVKKTDTPSYHALQRCRDAQRKGAPHPDRVASA